MMQLGFSTSFVTRESDAKEMDRVAESISIPRDVPSPIESSIDEKAQNSPYPIRVSDQSQ